MKRRVEDLALFGGAPLFTPFRSTAQLANKGADAFFDYVHQAFERRRLTNQGPLVSELEETLRAYHGTRHCIAFANACLAILIALRAIAARENGDVVLPAMSFRGLPHLVRWAGFAPRYCEIDPARHTLDPVSLARVVGSDTVAVLAVDNVNAMCDVDAIEKITRARSIPLLIDSVYGVAGKYGADPAGTRGDATVFTLHATKIVNGFEGGYVTTNDDALADRLRLMRNFGFGGDRNAQLLGMNAKLNEVHAAMALANFAHIDETIAGNKARFGAYREAFAGLPGIDFADYSNGPANYALVLLRIDPAWPFTREETQKLLRAENALVRPYYSPTLYCVDPDYDGTSRFPIADAQSELFLQLPAGEMMSDADVALLAETFRFLHAQAPAIAARLRGGEHGR